MIDEDTLDYKKDTIFILNTFLIKNPPNNNLILDDSYFINEKFKWTFENKDSVSFEVSFVSDSLFLSTDNLSKKREYKTWDIIEFEARFFLKYEAFAGYFVYARVLSKTNNKLVLLSSNSDTFKEIKMILEKI